MPQRRIALKDDGSGARERRKEGLSQILKIPVQKTRGSISFDPGFLLLLQKLFAICSCYATAPLHARGTAARGWRGLPGQRVAQTTHVRGTAARGWRGLPGQRVAQAIHVRGTAARGWRGLPGQRVAQATHVRGTAARGWRGLPVGCPESGGRAVEKIVERPHGGKHPGCMAHERFAVEQERIRRGDSRYQLLRLRNAPAGARRRVRAARFSAHPPHGELPAERRRGDDPRPLPTVRRNVIAHHFSRVAEHIGEQPAAQKGAIAGPEQDVVPHGTGRLPMGPMCARNAGIKGDLSRLNRTFRTSLNVAFPGRGSGGRRTLFAISARSSASNCAAVSRRAAACVISFAPVVRFQNGHICEDRLQLHGAPPMFKRSSQRTAAGRSSTRKGAPGAAQGVQKARLCDRSSIPSTACLTSAVVWAGSAATV